MPARAAARLDLPSVEAHQVTWAPTAPPVIPQRLIYPTSETKRLLGISHNMLYILLQRGDLDGIKVGGKTAITAESIQRYIATRPRVYSAA